MCLYVRSQEEINRRVGDVFQMEDGKIVAYKVLLKNTHTDECVSPYLWITGAFPWKKGLNDSGCTYPLKSPLVVDYGFHAFAEMSYGLSSLYEYFYDVSSFSRDPGFANYVAIVVKILIDPMDVIEYGSDEKGPLTKGNLQVSCTKCTTDLKEIQGVFTSE